MTPLFPLIFLALALALAAASAPASAQQPQPDAPKQPASGTAATAAPQTQAPEAAQTPAQAPVRSSVAPQPAQDLDGAQTPIPAPAQQTPPTTLSGTPAAQAASAPEPVQPGGVTEEDLKKMLVGKVLYLRGGYLNESLSFNEHGVLTGHSPQGSYTLSGVAIEKVHLIKHKVELEGQRYGLHFLGALPKDDPTTEMDRVLITPRKKVLKITIDREMVVTPKKNKEKNGKPAPVGAAHPSQASDSPASRSPQPLPQPGEPSETEQAKAEMAAAPAAERPADPASVTTTTSPAHATALLKDAIGRIFSVGFDDQMMAAMPDFWKLYYQAAAARTDYRPRDPAVLRQSAVDKKARLVSVFEPGSNEYAQAHGVAGLALYHVVIGADGKPGEIAVARPIGFGLDENAADAIRKASFEPAIKDGKPVPVLLDLIVEFHIYSGLTGGSSKPAPQERVAAAEMTGPGDQPAAPVLPGPYSLPHP